MIIDGAATFGEDPTAKSDCSVDTLRRAMDRHGIDRACIYSQLAVRMDARRGNDEVLDLSEKDKRFRPVAVIDPRHTSSGASEVDRCCAAGVRLFRLFPQEHGYPWRYEPLVEIWEALQRNGAALVVAQDIMGQSSALISATQDYRFAKVLIGCQYYTFTEYLAVLRKAPDTYLMAVGVNYPGAFETLVGEIGSRRICFGTNAPIYYVGASLEVLLRAGLADKDREETLSGTMLRLLGETK
ncbi:MAG: amidohydrolase family protein [bacterium]